MIASIQEMFRRMLGFFHQKPLDGDFDLEAATHLELAVEENTRQGMPPDEARRQALIRFGGVQQSKEQYREARSLPILEILARTSSTHSELFEKIKDLPSSRYLCLVRR
jgi:hypothetical protein